MTNEPSRPRGRRRRRLVFAGIAVLAIGAAGGVSTLQSGRSTPKSSGSALATEAVVRANLSSTTEVDGTLGYSGSFTVPGSGAGRATWLPDEGDVIRRGERVYAVDDTWVRLLYGERPFWRDLRLGVSRGYDVKELESNLDALGYGDGMTVDRRFTSATRQAIIDWQRDLGVTKTGEVKLSEVIVQPRGIRVTKLQAVLGTPIGGTVLTASSLERRVTVKLPVSERQTARKGATVRITLPGGKSTTGRIVSVGKVATAGTTTTQSQTGEGTENATVAISITVNKSGDSGDLDSAPVTVGFLSNEHKNVLAVPVSALLATPQGTYSVNVADSSGTVRSVPVKLGVFDGDRVEVSGNLTPGERVQVPKL